MPLVNEILNGRYSQLVQRLLGVRTPSTAMPQVAPELQPSIVLENDRPEWKYLYNENLYICGFNITATAGNTPAFRLRLPGTADGMSVIARIEEICVQSPAATNLIQIAVVAAGNLDLGSILTPTVRDGRVGTLPVCVASGGDATPVPGARFQSGTAQPIVLNTPHVLAQGFSSTASGRSRSLQISGQTVASLITGYVAWSERPIDNDEVARSL